MEIQEHQKLEIAEFLIEAKNQSPAHKRKVASVMYNCKTGTIIPDTLSVNGLLDPGNLNYVTSLQSCESESDPNVTFNSVFHAEEQTIMKTVKKINAGGDCSDMILFCTFSPCYNCCRIIIMSGCKHVIYLEEHESNFTCSTEIIDDMSPKELLAKYGVISELFQIPKKPKNQKEKPIKTMVVYHSADLDGFASGYLLEKKLTNITGKKPLMFGYNYQKEHDFMKEVENNPENQYCIYFGDVTPPIEWLSKIKSLLFGENSRVKITIFDHHADALDKISKWYSNTIQDILMRSDCNPTTEPDGPTIRIITNSKETNHSGAKLIYDYFNWVYVLPKSHNLITFLVNNISLYDTWEFTKLPKNQKLEILYVHEYLMQFKEIETFSEFLDNFLDEKELLKEINIFGSIMVDIKRAEAQKILDSAVFSEIQVNDTYQRILVLGNTYPNYYLSEMVEEIEKQYGTKHISCWISWNIKLKTNEVSFSVRAQNEGGNFSILPICYFYGGGGHPKAGGFTVPLSDGLKIISDFEKFK